MSINKVIEVKDKYAPLEAERLNVEGKEEITDEDYPSIDKSGTNLAASSQHDSTIKNDDYEGRKHKPDIDGPIEDSQETDEIYTDPRDDANLPPAGKNAGDLTVDNLGRGDNKI